MSRLDIPGVPVMERRHSRVLASPLAAPRDGIMLHYDDSSRGRLGRRLVRRPGVYQRLHLAGAAGQRVGDRAGRSRHAHSACGRMSNAHGQLALVRRLGRDQWAGPDHRGATRCNRERVRCRVRVSRVGRAGHRPPHRGTRRAGDLDTGDHARRRHVRRAGQATLESARPQGGSHRGSRRPTADSGHQGHHTASRAAPTRRRADAP